MGAKLPDSKDPIITTRIAMNQTTRIRFFVSGYAINSQCNGAIKSGNLFALS